MSETEPQAIGRTLGKMVSRVWWLPLVRGIFLVLLGAYALFKPAMTIVALTQLLGIFLVADGIITLIAALKGTAEDRGSTILRGALELLAGVLVMSNAALVAGITSTVILYLVAIVAIATGVIEIIAARRKSEEFWPYISGAIAILFGILILVAPLAFGQLFIRLFGLAAIIQGVFLIVLAFRVRSLGQAASE